MTTVIREIRHWSCIVMMFFSGLIALGFVLKGDIFYTLLALIIFALFYIASDIIWILTEIQAKNEPKKTKSTRKKR